MKKFWEVTKQKGWGENGRVEMEKLYKQQAKIQKGLFFSANHAVGSSCSRLW